MEPLIAVDPKFQELVIKNFGATAAYNVRIESEPEIVREWQGDSQKVPLPLIPTLVPGQEWRRFEFAYALDWAMNLDRLSVDTYGVHHGVKELKKLREQLGKRTPKS